MSDKRETIVEEMKRKHPVRWRWEYFKICCTELLAKWFNIHIDWYWP